MRPLEDYSLESKNVVNATQNLFTDWESQQFGGMQANGHTGMSSNDCTTAMTQRQPIYRNARKILQF